MPLVKRRSGAVLEGLGDHSILLKCFIKNTELTVHTLQISAKQKKGRSSFVEGVVWIIGSIVIA